jgi:chorismate mutase
VAWRVTENNFLFDLVITIASANALRNTMGETNFDLCTSPESKCLHDAMSESFAALQSAHQNYERALQVAQETDPLTPERIVALQQRRIEYAKAVTQYHSAAMAWLSHADTTRENDQVRCSRTSSAPPPTLSQNKAKSIPKPLSLR